MNNGHPDEFARDNVPPKREGELWIERMKANGRKQFTIYSRHLWGIWTHWDGKRSQPCYKDKKKCLGCGKGLPTRWKAYVHAYDHIKRMQVFVELTPTASRSLLDQIGKGLALRGVVMTLQRTAAQNGRLNVHLDKVTDATMHLPAEVDPFQTLCSIWGITRPDDQVDDDRYEGGMAIPA